MVDASAVRAAEPAPDTPPCAWLFNLDAEEELRHPGRHSRSPDMQSKLERYAPFLRPLMGPADILVDDRTRRVPDGTLGQAWCPTPTAVDRLREVGARLPRLPALEVLRQVNHRAFTAALGQTLPGAAYVTTQAALLDNAAASPGVTWLLKRPFSFSGRHRMRCPLPTAVPHELKWITATFRLGEGLQMEPWVDRVIDCVVHGWIEPDGTVRLGRVAEQVCDARGAWQETQLADDARVAATDADTLQAHAQEAAEALATAGYFGPFGVDSYRWKDADGTLHWNPRGEINARYTMGWHVGMQNWRPRLPLD